MATHFHHSIHWYLSDQLLFLYQLHLKTPVLDAFSKCTQFFLHRTFQQGYAVKRQARLQYLLTTCHATQISFLLLLPVADIPPAAESVQQFQRRLKLLQILDFPDFQLPQNSDKILQETSLNPHSVWFWEHHLLKNETFHIAQPQESEVNSISNQSDIFSR